MKAFLFGICAVCSFSASSFAQVSTIQVSVTDTIDVPANHLTVLVSFRDSASLPEDPTNFSASRAEVTHLLDQNKVRWEKASNQLGFLAIARMDPRNKKIPDNDISIDFHSAAQMDLLMPGIKTIAFVEATETGTSVDKDQLDLTGLYDKLLKKAKAKADLLARLSGRKVGAVYQIGSAFDAFNPATTMESMMGGGSAYGEMMKSLMGNMLNTRREDRKISIAEHLTVTYLLQ